MNVKVKTEFKDKYTGELHKVGDILEVDIQRINEILKVGSFVELIEPTEQKQEETEPIEQPPEDSNIQEENGETGEQTEDVPKQASRRKRSR